MASKDKDQTQIVIKPDENKAPLVQKGHPPAKKPAPFKHKIDEETLKKLRYAGVVYGLASAFLLFVALTFLLRASFLNGSLSLVVSLLLAAMSWQCLRHVIKL